MRQLLNVAYSWLAQGRDRRELAKLDAVLAGPDVRPQSTGTGDLRALMASARLPQSGAGVPKKRKGAKA